MAGKLVLQQDISRVTNVGIFDAKAPPFHSSVSRGRRDLFKCRLRHVAASEGRAQSAGR
jgi:hypothetical protein